MKKQIRLGILIFTLILLAVTNTKIHPQTYSLIWSDEFDGTSIDLNKWAFDVGTGGKGWGNNELEYYTSRAANAYIENGNLVIKALSELYSGRNYTSARMKTQGKFSCKYGKIEARIKLPYGQGIWPAFWMLGDNITTVSWPKCGEIDIMELIGGSGSRDRTAYGTLHWDDNGHKSSGKSYALNTGKFADDYHLFSITWDPNKIVLYVDDNAYHIVSISSAAMAAFQKNFFLILNLAVGGNWPGNPDATTVFPQTMLVDYVRVYKDTDQTDVSPENKNSQPVGFNLDQNFPNPFNPSTTISYSSATDGFVTLKIYDMLGNEIRTLVNERKTAGNYLTRFDSSGVPSGVYLYSLTVHSDQGKGDYKSVRKMMAIK